MSILNDLDDYVQRVSSPTPCIAQRVIDRIDMDEHDKWDFDSVVFALPKTIGRVPTIVLNKFIAEQSKTAGVGERTLDRHRVKQCSCFRGESANF